VKFLSDEWAQTVKDRINGSAEFKAAAGKQSAKIQQVVTMPDGTEVKYWLTLAAGQVDMGTGAIEKPDATISQDYETAVGLSKNELSPVAAFMSGKIKIDGLMKIMGMQSAMGQLPKILGDLEVEY
jgi:putative sterol carrier protein